MPSAVRLREDYSAEELRGLASRSKNVNQSRRLLSLAAVLICSPKTGPFRVRVFRVIFPWLGGAEDDESLEVFGRPKGVHSPAGR